MIIYVKASTEIHWVLVSLSNFS